MNATDENGTALAIGDRMIPNTNMVDGDLFSTARVLGEIADRPGYIRIEWEIADGDTPNDDVAEAARSRMYGGPAQ